MSVSSIPPRRTTPSPSSAAGRTTSPRSWTACPASAAGFMTVWRRILSSRRRRPVPAKPQRQVRIGGIDGVQLVGNEDDDLVRQTGAQVVKQGISGFAVKMGGGFVDE